MAVMSFNSDPDRANGVRHPAMTAARLDMWMVRLAWDGGLEPMLPPRHVRFRAETGDSPVMIGRPSGGYAHPAALDCVPLELCPFRGRPTISTGWRQ